MPRVHAAKTQTARALPSWHGLCSWLDMVLGVIIGSVLVAMTAYGFWMAGEMGVGPRWRSGRRDPTPGSDVEPVVDR